MRRRGKRILCATDLLPKTEGAVERATMIARRLGAQLSIMHVVGSLRDERNARTALVKIEERLVSALGNDGIAPSVLVRRGDAASQMIGMVHQIAPDLVVLGPRYRRPVCDRLGESLAERILSLRRCPVLIVKHGSTERYRDILLALDLSPAAGEVIRTTESLVMESGADTSVIHAFEPNYGMLPYVPRAIESVGVINSAERAAAERGVQQLLRENSDRLVDCNLILSGAYPAEAILSAIKRMQPNLLVIGTSGYGRFRRALLGSTASQLLDAASCDLLVVPRGSTQQILGGRLTAKDSSTNTGAQTQCHGSSVASGPGCAHGKAIHPVH
jgi:universal stress protein E